MSTPPALQALEWPRFIEYASKLALSLPAREQILSLASSEGFAQNVEQAMIQQQETSEITAYLDRESLWGSLRELASPESALDRLSRGFVCEAGELALLKRWLSVIASWKEFPEEDLSRERLKRAFLQLPECAKELALLERVLDPNGEISERASPKLSQLHQEIRSIKHEIAVILDQLLKSYSTQGILQENFSDVRDGRYVIPIKISHQNDIDGIVYEASASGQSVFVEPREVGLLGNRLRLRQNDLIQEVYRVLQETCRAIQPRASALALGISIITHWDAVQAKARMGLRFGARPLTVTSDRVYRLPQTAHPLLWWSLEVDSIVRNDLEFGEPTRTLLLTGPNTGGKTVLLKTLGLAGLCARSGFPFPCEGDPVVPFFDSFFVDLGDPQSIAEHLSSFSGHILRFKQILENFTSQSLVLIDELNSATDPEEGAALGRAFLESLMSKGAIIVSTTHDPQLKALAISDSRILNASMAFDERARTPTYTMILGVPGRSRALETAERLGMPESVLKLAREYLSRNHRDFEATLERLESELKEAAIAKREATRLRDEAETARRQWVARAKEQGTEILIQARQKLRHVLSDAQEQVRAAVRKLEESRTRRDLGLDRTALNQVFKDAEGRLESAFADHLPDAANAIGIEQEASDRAIERALEIQVGEIVRVPQWKTTGAVLAIQGSQIKVAMGSISLSIPKTEIERLKPGDVGFKSKPKSIQVQTSTDDAALSAQQIDVRGERFEDAMGMIEKFLDFNFRAGHVVQVTIVHGLGTGALREGTRKLLKRLPYIKEFRDSDRGGAGATLVEFERT